MYILSFLRGMALDYFNADILGENDGTVPYWDGNFPLFIEELELQFGPYDSVADAEAGIENLRMKDSERITKYIVRFNQYATMLSWGDSALRYAFYKGLANRIKDDLSKLEIPRTLIALRIAAQGIDQRYWRREDEKKRDSARNTTQTKSSSSTSTSNNRNTGSNSGTSSSTNRSSNPTSSSKPKPGASNSDSGSSSAPKPKPNVELTKDGHITQAERDRRMKNNLCLYCGGAGHVSKDCRKRANPGSTSGRAAQTSETPKTPSNKDSSTPEAKK
jgi:hypothetical protein